MQRNHQFIRFWGALTRLWEGLRLAEVTVLGEEINGDRATVDAEVTLGTLAKARSKIELVQEDGRWKLVRSPGPDREPPRVTPTQQSQRRSQTPTTRSRSTLYRPPLR